MKAKKKSRGITFADDLWLEVTKNARLINYNPNQFMETCIRSIIEIINNPEKRRLPLIVRMVDEAKSDAQDFIHVPIHIVDDTTVHQPKDKAEKKQKEPVLEGET